LATLKAFRLPDDLKEKLEKTAKKTNRTETFYVVQALKHYFEKQFDYQTAKDRFEDNDDEIITSEEMRKRLGL
jgi:predicted DNA-binding protein